MAETITTYAGPIMFDVRYRREYLGERCVLKNRHVPNFQEAGIDTAVLPAESIDELRHLYSEAEETPATIEIVDTPAGLDGARARGSLKLIVAGSFQTIADKVDLIPLLHRLGMRMFSLTLNRRNLIGDGCTERTQAGLSHFGVSVVQKLADSGVIIDVSHASEPTFWDVLDTVQAPILASHSNCRAVCDNARNLTDEQIVALAEGGGVVALSMHPTMVAHESPSARHIIDHLDHVVELVGVDHVAFGTDYIDYVLDFFRHKLVSGDPSGSLYGSDHTYPQGIETLAKTHKLVDLMKDRGYRNEDIAKVTRQNFVDLWSRVDGLAKRT